jgi:hypothetical protein
LTLKLEGKLQAKFTKSKENPKKAAIEDSKIE